MHAFVIGFEFMYVHVYCFGHIYFMKGANGDTITCSVSN